MIKEKKIYDFSDIKEQGKENLKILLVYPQYPNTFWSFQGILKFINKKAAFPPLGLLTVAAMLPEKWDLKLIDMNVDNLNDSDILSADAVFISAMIVQKKSVKDVIKRVKKLGKPIAAGGPLFTTGWEEFTDDVDSLILGEAESNLEDFLNDLSNGNVKKIYEVGEFPSISKAVSPRWNLINMKYYNSMCLQISRGCPFNCDFCDIVKLNGRIPRIKTGQQVINELEALYKSGWKGGVFFVDDNLIGNQRILEQEILPAIIEWQKKRRQPFLFNTQASIDLADKPELMRLMVKAGFTTIFVGIESPQDESLKECSKYQNKNRDLLKSVNILQNAGFEIQGGFIVGFDSDSPHIFQKQIEFIQKSGIVTAMVGLLNALPQTKLYQRLKETGRLIKESSGLNTGMDMNFIPKMNLDVLMDGYKKIVKTIYSPKQYYERVKTFLSEFKPPFRKAPKLHLYYIKALFVSIWYSGIKASGKKYYWKLFFWSVFRRPTMFPYVIGTSITRIHFSKLYCES